MHACRDDLHQSNFGITEDSGTGAIEEVAPALATFRRSLGYPRVIRQWMKEVRVGLDQLGPPIPHDICHHKLPRNLHCVEQNMNIRSSQ